jgi:hypothetical protein
MSYQLFHRAWQSCLNLVALAVLSFLCAGAAGAQNTPEVTRGQQWLLARMQAASPFESGPEQHANATQAAAEAARTLKLVNAIPPALVDQVVADDDEGTENLARRVIALRAAGRPADAALASLIQLQNVDGGFGGGASYASNALDTVWALLAAAKSSAGADTAAAAVRYLLASQRSSGAYGFSSGPDDIAVTAQALAALQLAGGGTEVTAAADRAAAWLRARQKADGSFGTVLESSLVQLALAGANSDPGLLGMNRSYLLGQQDAQGSWGADVYITAVALRALSATGGTGTGNVTGVVRDAVSGAALAASAVLDAGSPLAVDASGRFTFAGVKPGAHMLAVGATGFATRQIPLDVRADTVLDLGTIGLSAVTTTGVLTGIVRSADNGAALAGVALRVSGAATATAFTSADGRYRLAGLTPGVVHISAAKSGYDSALADATLQAGVELEFSPTLKTALGAARVSGVVTDAATGAPLAGASVTVAGQTAVTGADGRYSIGGLAAGTLPVQVSAAGYTARGLALVLDGIAEFNLPPISLSKDAPPGTTGTVSGIVTAKVGGAPLAGVTVTVSGSASMSATTGADGSYRLDGIAPGAVTVSATRSGYVGAGGTASVQAGQTILFSPQLDALQTPGVRAVVVDSVSHQPLAQVSATLDALTVLSDAGGGLLFATVPSGNHTLTLAAAGYLTRRMPVQTDGATPLDLKVIELARTSVLMPLAGKVTDQASGKPIGGAEVTVVGTQFATVTGADGSYRIEGLAQGDVSVRYSASGYIGDIAIYTLSPYSPAAQDHALVAGQAGAVTLAVGTDAAHYPAYAPVKVSAQLGNEASAAADVRITLLVQDGAGNYIASMPATWLDADGAAQPVFHLQPGATSVPLVWNTLAYAPGRYRVAVRVTRAPETDADAAPLQLAEQHVDFDIDPTAALGSVRITPVPAYATVGAVDQLGYRIDVENRSNLPVASTLAYRLSAPDATLVDSGLVVLNLAPEEATQSRLLSGPQYRYPAAGKYPAILTPASEVAPAQLAAGEIEVAPATNVTPSMLVTPATIVPAPDQRVHIDLRLHGVEQK